MVGEAKRREEVRQGLAGGAVVGRGLAGYEAMVGKARRW